MWGLKRWRVSSRLQKSGPEVGPTHRCRAAGKNLCRECKIGGKANFDVLTPETDSQGSILVGKCDKIQSLTCGSIAMASGSTNEPMVNYPNRTHKDVIDVMD